MRGSKLSGKLTIGIAILAVVLCVTSCTIGYFLYQNEIRRTYNDFAYYIADVANSYFSNEELKLYTQTAKEFSPDTKEYLEVINSESYQNTRNLIIELRDNMDANDIYIVDVDVDALHEYSDGITDWLPFTYVYDSYRVVEENFLLGAKGTMNPDYIPEVIDLIETGKRSDNFFLSKSDFGNNTSALVPLYDDNGDFLALMGVEIPLTTIQSALNRYLAITIIATVLVIFIFLYVFWTYLQKKVIKPIAMVTEVTGKFSENETASEELLLVDTKDEVEVLAKTVHKMQTSLNEYLSNITAITAEKERIAAELDVAKNIQSSMLPSIFPAFPEREEFDIYASMVPAKEVGGDFYDFFLIDDNHLAMTIADVSGKGVPAALFMVNAKTLLKIAALSGLSPKGILEKVNNQICENNEAEMFVTVWVGILEISTGVITCSNAGHEYPVIKKGNSHFELIKDKHGFVLAGMEETRYVEYEIQLNKGDVLYVYTDGVTEAMNSEESLFGTVNMMKSLNKNRTVKPETILNNMKKDIENYVADAPQFDDITMLCLEYKL